MTETLNDCRRDFEAWVLRGSMPQENLLERLPDESYRWQIINCGWLAWQACWSLCDERVKGVMA